VLLTGRLMKISGAHTKYNFHSLRRIKTSSSSAVSVISQTGGLHCALHMATFSDSVSHSNSRTHTLLNELKDNGLKGDLVDFV
jgi:hypothetical protein